MVYVGGHDYCESIRIFNLICLFYGNLYFFWYTCFAGWGGPGGRVYQKAYVEFFCSPDKLKALVEKCKNFPSLTYIAVNKDGDYVSNIGPNDVNAVTWGVFPAKEIIQPTVVDPTSFKVWKDEAFEIWTRGWARMYQEGDSSIKILEEVTELLLPALLVAMYIPFP